MSDESEQFKLVNPEIGELQYIGQEPKNYDLTICFGFGREHYPGVTIEQANEIIKKNNKRSIKSYEVR